jgi:uncharacterized membrane protein YdjX (TVP38/TMEM64 family)
MKLNKDKLSEYSLVVIAVIAIIVFSIIFRHKIHDIRFIENFKHLFNSPKNLKRYILSYGSFSVLAFIAIYSIKPVLLIVPSSLLSILAGNIFGPWYGLILSMISCFFSASLAFFLAKKLGKSFVDKLLKGKGLKIDSDIEKHGFKVMLLMRLSFVFPYDPLSYAAGLSSMRYKDFISGTILGILPEMVAYSFMGKSFERPFSFKFFLPIIAITVIALTASYYYKTVRE